MNRKLILNGKEIGECRYIGEYVNIAEKQELPDYVADYKPTHVRTVTLEIAEDGNYHGNGPDDFKPMV
jgi:hypothetical protein